MGKRSRRAAVVAVLAAIVAAAFWQRWRVLGATPFPVGVDGYFYPVQLRALLEHGTLRYPASPLTFYWMLPFAAATDPITGAKLAAALGTSLIAIPAYGVGARLGGHRGAGFVAAVIAAMSASDGYLALEFVKQGIGLTVAVAALEAILRALEPRPDPLAPGARIGGARVFARPRVALATLALVAVLATHKLAGGLVLAIALPAAIAGVRGALRGRRLIYAVLLGVALGLALAVAGIVAPRRFVAPADLALVGRSLVAPAHLDAPALVTANGALAFGHEALLAGLVSLVALAILIADRRRAPAARTAGIAIALLGIGIALPVLRVDDPQALGFRLRLAAFVPLALSTAVWAGALARRFPRPASALLVGLALAIAGVELRHERREGVVFTHPALAGAVSAAYGRIPANATVIVPERHILFMVDWYTRAPVRLRPEPIPRRHRVRLFGLVFLGGKGSPLDRALYEARADHRVEPPLGLHPDDPNGLMLVSEPTWSWLLGHLPDRERAHFAAWPTI